MNDEAMTLNERLVLHKELDNFEEAIRTNSKQDLLIILNSIGIENPNIDFIMENTKLKHESLFKLVLKKVKKIWQ